MNILVGRWITSFELEFADQKTIETPFGNLVSPPRWSHTVFLARFEFAADFTFALHQRRNKGGKYDEKLTRTGTYSLDWIAGVAGGDMAIAMSSITLHFFMRNQNELHFMMRSEGDAYEPIAQGTMYRAEVEVVEP